MVPGTARIRDPDGMQRPDTSGGEGDRTPDLVNAIHALSQLSYAPVILARPAGRSCICKSTASYSAGARYVKLASGLSRCDGG